MYIQKNNETPNIQELSFDEIDMVSGGDGDGEKKPDEKEMPKKKPKSVSEAPMLKQSGSGGGSVFGPTQGGSAPPGPPIPSSTTTNLPSVNVGKNTKVNGQIIRQGTKPIGGGVRVRIKF